MGKKVSAAVEIASRIVVDPRLRFGNPTIKGTRVPVAVVLDELAAGSTVEDIVREYGVTPEDVRAVLRYAASVMAEEDVKVASR
jgi:uncharacterized protein (DUF433 family)